MEPSALFEHLIAKKDLSFEEMQEVLQACLEGTYTDLQTATFLALMRMKGESIEELYAAACLMEQKAHHLDLGEGLIDIAGTGGDGRHTFNISTAAAFVIAAAGIPIAKHGNRSVSSKSGSFDLLEAAGFKLTLTDASLKECMKRCRLAFLFAPNFHKTMLQVKAAREGLKIRTFFNLLGPMSNPCGVKRQVLGVSSEHLLKPMAQVLARLGRHCVLLVHAKDQLDELSCVADTLIYEYRQQAFKTWTLDPKYYGLKNDSLDSLIVKNPQESLSIVEAVLDGAKGPARDIVTLNAAAGIYCAHDDKDFSACIDEAQGVLDNGQAKRCFYTLAQLTQELD